MMTRLTDQFGTPVTGVRGSLLQPCVGVEGAKFALCRSEKGERLDGGLMRGFDARV